MKGVETGIITGLLTLMYLAHCRNSAPVIRIVDALPGGYNAMTIPPFGIWITKNEAKNANLLAHELIHWRQYQELGLIAFVQRYTRELQQYGYDFMPMEIEARFNEPAIVKYNYTQAVRNGTANTVYNPNFRL